MLRFCSVSKQVWSLDDVIGVFVWAQPLLFQAKELLHTFIYILCWVQQELPCSVLVQECTVLKGVSGRWSLRRPRT